LRGPKLLLASSRGRVGQFGRRHTVQSDVDPLDRERAFDVSAHPHA